MTKQILELQGAQEAKRKAWMDFYAKFESVGDAQAPKMTGEDMNQFKALESEFNDAKSAYDAAVAIHGAKSNVPPQPVAEFGGSQTKSLNQAIAERGGLKGIWNAGGPVELPNVDMRGYINPEYKTTMTTAAGFAQDTRRDGTIVPKVAVRPVQLLDYLTIRPTEQSAIVYMEQTTRTNNAAEVAEGSAFGEAAVAFTERTAVIKDIGVFLPVTYKQLDDVAFMNAWLDSDLGEMVRQRLDLQVYTGDGTGENLTGILNGTSVQSQAKGADPVMTAIAKAAQEVRIDGLYTNANLVVMHGRDYTNLATTTTSDGVYILGNPVSNMPLQIWGMPIVLNEGQAAGTACVLDSRQFVVAMRTGLTMEKTNAHASLFVANTYVLKAWVRAGLAIYCSQAACKVTGI